MSATANLRAARSGGQGRAATLSARAAGTGRLANLRRAISPRSARRATKSRSVTGCPQRGQLHQHWHPASVFEFRSFTVAEIDKRPVFGARHQFPSQGIFQDVIRFLPAAFLVPQPVFKKSSCHWMPMVLAVHSFHLLMTSRMDLSEGGKDSSAWR